jgi:hypothetical protein
MAFHRCLTIALESPEFITKLNVIINTFLTPTHLKISLTLSVFWTVPFLYIAWTWFRYLSPAVICAHLPFPSPWLPSDCLYRGFIAFTCLYIIQLLSSSWRFKRRETPHISFDVPSVAFSTWRDAWFDCYLVIHVERLLRVLQLFYFDLWPIYWLSLIEFNW